MVESCLVATAASLSEVPRKLRVAAAAGVDVSIEMTCDDARLLARMVEDGMQVQGAKCDAAEDTARALAQAHVTIVEADIISKALDRRHSLLARSEWLVMVLALVNFAILLWSLGQ